MKVTINGVEYDPQTPCGHCRHGLVYHLDSGPLIACCICHCLRGPEEDIAKEHRFSGGAA